MSDEKTPQLVTITRLCEAFHRTDQTVRAMMRQGIIPGSVKRVGRKPFYDYWECHHAFLSHIDNKGEGKSSIQNELVAKRIKKLDREEEEARGKLVNAQEVRRELVKLFTVIRGRIRSIGPKCAQEIAHLKTAKKKQRELMSKIQSILSKEHDEALKELSAYKGGKE